MNSSWWPSGWNDRLINLFYVQASILFLLPRISTKKGDKFKIMKKILKLNLKSKSVLINHTFLSDSLIYLSRTGPLLVRKIAPVLCYWRSNFARLSDIFNWHIRGRWKSHQTSVFRFSIRTLNPGLSPLSREMKGISTESSGINTPWFRRKRSNRVNAAWTELIPCKCGENTCFVSTGFLFCFVIRNCLFAAVL